MRNISGKVIGNVVIGKWCGVVGMILLCSFHQGYN